jgi:hypothetical protein
MKQRISPLFLWLLVAVLPVSAQTLPARPDGVLPSLPTLLLPKAAPEKAAWTDAEKRLLPLAAQAEPSALSSTNDGETSAQRLPYGVGFENRQQCMGGGCGGGGRGGGWGGKGRGR